MSEIHVLVVDDEKEIADLEIFPVDVKIRPQAHRKHRSIQIARYLNRAAVHIDNIFGDRQT